MMGICWFLGNDDDEKYRGVKKGVIGVRKKSFEFDDGRRWKVIGIMEKGELD